MSAKTAFEAPKECPICGEDVPKGARACPHCGADERTGWAEETTRYDGVDLPDEAFDYNEALRGEGLEAERVPKHVPVFSWFVAILLAAVLITLVVVYGRF
jgi:hypothetical protein